MTHPLPPNSLEHPADLPFEGDAHSQTLVRIVALMVFLVSSFLCFSFLSSDLITQWEQGAASGFTVELAPSEGATGGAQVRDMSAQWKALEILGKVKGVTKTEVISKSALSGITGLFGEVSTRNIQEAQPVFIDVQVSDMSEIDLRVLDQVFQRHVPGATIHPEREFHENMKQLLSIATVVTFLLTSLVLGIAFALAVFSAHSGLVIHKKIIEILHLVGAQDVYIANQFQQHALRLGLRGGLYGAALSLGTLVFFYIQLPGSTAATQALFSFQSLGPIVGAPLVITALMVLAARLTVMRELSRQP